MGQIITTQNLVAIKEVRHAGQQHHNKANHNEANASFRGYTVHTCIMLMIVPHQINPSMTKYFTVIFPTCFQEPTGSSTISG